MVRRAEVHPETFIEHGHELDVTLAGGIVHGPYQVNRYRGLSVQFENLQAGGGETITAKVWVSNKASPGTCTHAGASDWSQLGSDIVLAPGDSEIYSWTTHTMWCCVTAEITTADTVDTLECDLLGKP